MSADDKVNILLVDDQAGKLLSYEVILRQLGENLIKASSGREALEYLLKTEIAVVLVDVCMPDLDGFQLAAMIREHPRFKKTAMIFISAIHLSDMDRLRGYEMGAVDYVPVPVIPEVLRAKVKVFAELYRKTRELEKLNAELELRVAARTAELQLRPAVYCKASSAAPSPSPQATWALGTGIASTVIASGTTASAGFSGWIMKRLPLRRKTFAFYCTPRTGAICKPPPISCWKVAKPIKASSAYGAPMAKYAGASAPPRQPSMKTATWCASAV